jgi:tryptophanyl-tRNA synthetase
MITDPQRARRTDPGNPDVCNVFSFHEIYTPGDVVQQIDGDCRTAALGCVDCKKILAKNLNKALDPIREKRRELEANLDKVKEIMERGNAKARSIAEKTMTEVREAAKL